MPPKFSALCTLRAPNIRAPNIRALSHPRSLSIFIQLILSFAFLRVIYLRSIASFLSSISIWMWRVETLFP